MRIVLGLLILAAATTPALATVVVPAPDLATGLPAVLAVVAAYAATRIRRR